MGNRHQHRPIPRVALLIGLAAVTACAADRLRFEIKLDPSVASSTTSGRLLVLMSTKAPKGNMISAGFIPGETWIAATEITAWKPGATITLDPDQKAFPEAFSTAKRGDYWVMALLDPNHSYGY